MAIQSPPLSFASPSNKIARTDLHGRLLLSRWAPIPLRLIVGFGFIEHGLLKIQRGPEAFAAVLHALGTPAPHFMTWATIATELLGGLAILLGAFVALASVPLAAVMLTAIFTVHLPFGFSSVRSYWQSLPQGLSSENLAMRSHCCTSPAWHLSSSVARARGQ